MYKLHNTDKYDKNNRGKTQITKTADNYIRDAVHWDWNSDCHYSNLVQLTAPATNCISKKKRKKKKHAENEREISKP